MRRRHYFSSRGHSPRPSFTRKRASQCYAIFYARRCDYWRCLLTLRIDVTRCLLADIARCRCSASRISDEYGARCHARFRALAPSLQCGSPFSFGMTSSRWNFASRRLRPLPRRISLATRRTPSSLYLLPRCRTGDVWCSNVLTLPAHFGAAASRQQCRRALSRMALQASRQRSRAPLNALVLAGGVP